MDNNDKSTENIAIRRTSNIKFIFFTIISLGLYWYVWMWKLITDVNRLSEKRHLHRSFWFPILIILECSSIWMNIKGIQKEFLLNSADLCWCILQLTLALQILKNIENYISEEFDITIKHNVLGWIFFSSFYINYKINKLPNDIKKAFSQKLKKLKQN